MKVGIYRSFSCWGMFIIGYMIWDPIDQAWYEELE